MLKQTGMGLIEVIIGLFIGLLVLLSAYATLITFSNNERTAVSGNSALENGITGIFQIEHDVKMAGAGLFANNTLGCTTLNLYYNGRVLANNSPIAPVVITNGNGSAPDSISIFYGTSTYAGAPTPLIQNMNSPNDNIVVNAGFNLLNPSLILLSTPGSANPCTVLGIGQSQVSNLNYILTPGTSSPYTPSSVSGTFSNPIAYSLGSYAASIGSVTWVTYQIVNNALQVIDNIQGTTSTLADNIVQMQAQYGVNTNGSIQWVDPTGSWAQLTNAVIPEVQAIRISIVARSTEKEKPSVRGGPCDATKQAPLTWVGGAAFDLSANPNWQCYRYRVLRTIIPLRNVIWGLTS